MQPEGDSASHDLIFSAKKSLSTKCSKNGVFLGKGGNGQFQSLVSEALSPDKKPFAWRFTRITSHKRDNSEMANGHLIYTPVGPASGGNIAKITPMRKVFNYRPVYTFFSRPFVSELEEEHFISAHPVFTRCKQCIVCLTLTQSSIECSWGHNKC